jgi:hypothetical protein
VWIAHTLQSTRGVEPVERSEGQQVLICPEGDCALNSTAWSSARPILFSTPMIRALLDRQKVQRRRIINPQPMPAGPDAYFDAYNSGLQWNWWTPDGKQYCSKSSVVPTASPGIYCGCVNPGGMTVMAAMS